MERNILPNQQPEIISLLDFAFVLIPMQSHPDYEDWIHNSSLHLIQYYEGDLYRLSFISKWRISEMLKIELIKFGDSEYTYKLCKNSILELILEQINRGYYIILDLNEYYLEHKYNYNIEDYFHISFIYGYDFVRKIFFTSGYNDNGIYGNLEYSFTDIQLAFLHANNRYLECIQANPDCKLEYSAQTLEKDIEAYLYGENLDFYYEKKVPLDYNFWEFEFAGEKKLGMSAQSSMVDLLMSYISGHSQETDLDLRNFRVIMEHKHILSNSLKYACSKIGMSAEIATMYDTQVKNIAEHLINVAIKYNLTCRGELLHRITNMLKDLILHENAILKDALTYLKNI